MTSRYTRWRKSTRSDDGNCVEVANAVDGTIGVRDSKDITGPILEFHPAAWSIFTSGLRVDKFSH
ncbi:DUF397 domain-containing protein [Micromonospora arida]|uniref:DUF397 domain-containing protein n=1 Tax=Micromonospora arida TaxID=2203715 RepID=A0A3N9XYA8_9ACTN|nr:DUF397 domain-containing protein [Micromonospora arida]RQX12623.1 DUF397 domain-containing protein [Micromonospora arida]